MLLITIKKYLIPVLLMATTATHSCVKDNYGTNPPPEADAMITLTMRLPGNTVATRSLPENIQNADEMKVTSVEVLVFDNESQQYLYTAHGNQISQTDDEVKFMVRLLEGGPVDLEVLANAGRWIGRSYGREIPVDEGLSKTQVRNTIAANVAPGEKWNTDPSDPNYNAFPMWGEVVGVTVNESLAATGINGIGMTRMMARIDVSLLAEAQTNFRLKTVRLYNYNTRGLVIPDTDDPTKWSKTEKKAVGASLPTDAGKANDPTAEAHALVYATTSENTACTAQIYTFEDKAGSTQDYLNNICLVIGGEFYDTKDNKWKESYYRADFANTVDYEAKYVPLKRNHRYRMQVSRITGMGYTDPDDAFRSLPANIEAGVLDWNESDMDEMWFDGTYYYSVSPLDIESWASATTDNRIKVKTDYPQWSYELSDLPTPGAPGANPSNVNWLKITSQHSPGVKYDGGGLTNYIVYSIDKNESGDERTAYIHVTAGRVTMTAKILQTLWIIERVYITPQGEIKPGGGTREVVVEGVFADTDVRVWDVTNNKFINEATVLSNSGITNNPPQSVELSVPELWHPTDRKQKYDRVVAFEYYSTEYGDFRLIRTEDQPSYWLNVTTNHVDGENIKGSGVIFEVQAWGLFPAVSLRAAIRELNGEYTTIAKSGGSLPAGYAENQSLALNGTLYVPSGNPTGTREVYLQYSTDNVQWTTISSGTQQRGNALFEVDNRDVYISSDFYEENGQKARLTWAEAAGISTLYNMQKLTSLSAHRTVIYPDESINPATGCGAYYEGDADDPLTGKGKWRLPTYNELAVIYENSDVIGNMNDYGLYTPWLWCAYEPVEVGAYCWNMNNGQNTTYVKDVAHFIRCVRTAPDL